MNKSYNNGLEVPFCKEIIEIFRFTASLCCGSALTNLLIKGIMTAWFSIHICCAWGLYHQKEDKKNKSMKRMNRWAKSAKMIADKAISQVIKIIGFIHNHGFWRHKVYSSSWKTQGSVTGFMKWWSCHVELEQYNINSIILSVTHKIHTFKSILCLVTQTRTLILSYYAHPSIRS